LDKTNVISKHEVLKSGSDTDQKTYFSTLNHAYQRALTWTWIIKDAPILQF